MSDDDATSTTAAADAPAKRATKKAATKKAATKKAATKRSATKVAKKATTKVAADDDAPAAADAPAKKVAKKATKRATTKKVAEGASSASATGADAAETSASPADGDAAGADARTRTRTRARGRRGSGGASSTEDSAKAAASDGAPADAPGADGGAAGDGAPDGEGREGEPGRRRRRRGGRGRRGRGGSGASRAESGAGSDAESDEATAGDDDSGTKEREGRKRARAKDGKATDGRAEKDADGKDAKDGKKKRKKKSSGGDDGDLPRGGTRMAAKKARRSGGQGATRGGGGGGGGGGQRRPMRHGGVTEEERRAILAGPPRTMLVTAKPERTQIAVMEDRTLVEHYVTRDEDVTFVGNIYMGRVQNVLPGMEAAFIDIGKGRNGVLYAGEVLYDEHDLEEESDQRIENVLKPGQKVLVQVTKDPMGTKGPRLTMHLSLAGRYVVLAPDSDLFGISRKLTDTERDRLRRIVKAAKPDGHGVIVRTAAEGATEEALTADVERLVERWRRVEEAAAKAKPLEAVYEEPKLVVKVIRDIFGQDFVRCIVDDDTLYGQVREYLDEVAPELAGRVELYGAPTDDERSQAAGAPSLADAEEAERVATEAGTTHVEVPAAERRRDLPDLFAAFAVTDQLRQAMNRKVWLPSGGYLIIEATEAMKVIDVNTGRFTGGSDSNLEEIVLKTNLEAADEIVRQLRLRDMGGMIIIDFIDMLLRSNQEQVVRRLKRELLRDRTKTRVSDVSRLGLVQMTRKNVSQGLVESFSSKCEKCDGHGFVTNL
jgi:Rne/Rng family ribonuclease